MFTILSNVIEFAKMSREKFNPENYLSKKYFFNEWTEFVIGYQNRTIFKQTIDSYKKNFNRRPIWALTYQERKIDDRIENNKTILDYSESEKGRFHLVEREWFNVNSDYSYRVLRFTNAGGNCNKVIVIYNDDSSNNFRIRQEEKHGGQWQVVMNKEIEEKAASMVYYSFGRTMLLTS